MALPPHWNIKKRKLLAHAADKERKADNLRAEARGIREGIEAIEFEAKAKHHNAGLASVTS